MEIFEEGLDTEKLRFIGTCVELRQRDLEAYDDTEREISYRTFLKHAGRKLIRRLEQGFGRSPTLKNDWHVRYGRGKWKGKPAICLMHSSIHHIWVFK